jgi:hypothetical protein
VILCELGSDERRDVTPNRLIVAGYTGRDEAAVAEHIAELAAIGVPPPPSVPAFYELDPTLVTVSDVIEVAGAHTSGEVEPVLIRHDGEYLLAVGSDHTDRDLERVDIADAKAACPKPVGAEVVSLGAAPEIDWDALTVQSSVNGSSYQRGGVGSLRHPADLLQRMTGTLGEVSGDFVLFCGTMPLLVGEFVYGQSWHVELTLPDQQRLIHSYRVKSVA